MDAQSDEDLWKISGVVIVAASISSVHLYAYDYRKNEMTKRQIFRLKADIGSYLTIMQMIKEPILMDDISDDDIDRISILVGTTDGVFEKFTLSLEFDFMDFEGYGGQQMLQGVDFGNGDMGMVEEGSDESSIREGYVHGGRRRRMR